MIVHYNKGTYYIDDTVLLQTWYVNPDPPKYDLYLVETKSEEMRVKHSKKINPNWTVLANNIDNIEIETATYTDLIIATFDEFGWHLDLPTQRVIRWTYLPDNLKPVYDPIYDKDKII